MEAWAVREREAPAAHRTRSFTKVKLSDTDEHHADGGRPQAPADWAARRVRSPRRAAPQAKRPRSFLRPDHAARVRVDEHLASSPSESLTPRNRQSVAREPPCFGDALEACS